MVMSSMGFANHFIRITYLVPGRSGLLQKDYNISPVHLRSETRVAALTWLIYELFHAFYWLID